MRTHSKADYLRLRMWVLAVIVTICGLSGAEAAQSQIGLKLGVQPWTPVTNDDTVQFLLDDPSSISNALNQGWQNYSGLLADSIKAALSQPDLVADGVSFYDIDLQLSQPLLTVERLDGSGIPGDPYHVAVEFLLNNEGATLSATQPTALGSYADPRCSIDFDAKVRIDLIIQNAVGAAFSSPQTQPDGAPLVQITRFDFDSHNLVCDFAVDLIKVLGLKDAIGRLVAQENGLVNKPLAEAGRGLVASTIATLNSTVAAYQRPEINLVILRAWLLDQAGGGKTIVLNLAPRAPLPDPTAGSGSMGGVITAANAQGIKSGQSGQVDCSQLPVTVNRVTGPRPMTSPYGTLGDWPLEALAVRLDCDLHVLQSGQHSNYRISRMSALFPQIVTYGSVRGKCVAYEAGVKQGIDIKTPWVQDVILPQELYSKYDLLANYTSIVCGGQATAYLDPKDRFLKYLFDQRAINESPFIVNITKQYLRSRGLTEALLQVAPIQVPENTTVLLATPPPPTCASNGYAANPGRARVVRSVNVRSGDTTDCTVIGQLQADSIVDVVSCTLANGTSSNWCQIRIGTNGAGGFVAKRFLAFGVDNAAPEDTQTAPADDEIVIDVPNGEDDLPDGNQPDAGQPEVDFPDNGDIPPPDLQGDQPDDAAVQCNLPRPTVYCPSEE